MSTTPRHIRQPAAPDRAVGLWLLGICALVVAMIAVGGATRLTDSGLSITEWDLGKGLWPPMTAERWAEEFDLYRRTTEYQTINRGMELAEFQFIYWWEWGHRFLGKLVGVAYGVPFFVFLAQGRLRGRLGLTTTLFALGGLQGAIGWWMVTSGLFGAVDVSAVRLAVHLGMAFVIVGLGFWGALQALGWPQHRAARAGGPGPIAASALLGVVFVQILLGALVAGLDAGRTFGDWPTIGGQWVPSSYWMLDPAVTNLWENVAAVQFNHRVMGYAAALAAVAIGTWAIAAGGPAARAAGALAAGVALAQTVLGVIVIVTGAPLSLSLVHQLGAVILWLSAVALLAASVAREPITASRSPGAQEFAPAA